MTYAEMLARVKSNVGGRDDKDDEIKISLNDAVMRIASLHRWDVNESTEELTLVTDQIEYDLPTGTTAVTSLYLERDDGYFTMLECISMFRFDRVFKAAGYNLLIDVGGITGDHGDGKPNTSLNVREGEPEVYAHFGNQVLMYPKPNASQNGLKFSVRVHTRPTAMSDDSDVNPLGEHFDQMVIAFATADTCAMLTLWDDAKGWEGRAYMYLREVKEQERARPDWTPRTRAAGRSMIP